MSGRARDLPPFLPQRGSDEEVVVLLINDAGLFIYAALAADDLAAG